MSSTQHQLIEQCAIRLRGIVEALDNIHDSTQHRSPHRWSTDLDDVHSSAESLLALINDQAPAPCIDCKGTGFCNSISGEEIRCPCRAPIQFADPAQSPVEQFEQAPPSEDQLIAAGLSYPLAKEDAVKLWYSGFRSEVITVLEAWEAIGHDTGINPDKEELLESLRNMAAICNAHGNDMPAQSAIDQRQVIADAITGALAFGAQASQPPAEDHWLRPFYDIGRAEGQRTQELAMLVRMLAASLKRHAPESNLVARATNYLAAKGLAGTPLRDPPAPVEQAGGDERVIGWRERILAAHPNSDPGFWPDALLVEHMAAEIADLRAALAQPSPAQAEQAEAEAERPEVFGLERYRVERTGQGFWPYCVRAGDGTRELFVGHLKQCKRVAAQLATAFEDGKFVAGALRAELETERMRLAGCGVAALGYFDGCADAYKSASLSDVLRLRADCDAALARVAKLELKLDQSDYSYDNDRHHMRGMAKQAAEAIQVFTGHDSGANLAHRYGDKWWEHLDELRDALLAFAKNAPPAQAQHSVPEISGIGRDAEHPRAVVLYLRNEPSEEDMRAIQNFLRAISADVLTQAQHSAGYAEARQCVNCRHIGINDAADYAACHDCRWTGPEPDEDKCPGCAGENCMAAACPECGGRYELVAEAKISTPAAQAGQVPQAWLDVQAERRRQVEAEGWTPEHDDAHSHGQMARAAACYALAGSSAPNDGTAALLVSLAWPWDEQWWKPTSARRDLVKACALGLAEIERLDRAAASQGGPSDA